MRIRREFHQPIRHSEPGFDIAADIHAVVDAAVDEPGNVSRRTSSQQISITQTGRGRRKKQHVKEETR